MKNQAVEFGKPLISQHILPFLTQESTSLRGKRLFDEFIEIKEEEDNEPLTFGQRTWLALQQS